MPCLFDVPGRHAHVCGEPDGEWIFGRWGGREKRLGIGERGETAGRM